jgi:hypothetical protein
MQHLEGSGTPVLYIGRAVFKGQINFNVHYSPSQFEWYDARPKTHSV